MIDPIEEIVNTHPLNQYVRAKKASGHPKDQSGTIDTVQISDTAKAALEETMETHAETTLKAKCGNREAQQTLEQEAARKALLGLD